MKWKNNFNKKYLQASLYIIFTAIVIYILSLLAKNAPMILYKMVEKIGWIVKVIKPIIIGFVFAYLFEPINKMLERAMLKIKLIKRERPARMIAVLITSSIFVIAIIMLISLLVYSVTDQLRLANFDDIIRVSEEYMANIDAFYQAILRKLGELEIGSGELESYFSEVVAYAVKIAKGTASSVAFSITNISGYFTTIFFSFIVALYLMIDGEMIVQYIGKVSFALFSKDANRKLSGIVNDLDTVFSGYIRGQLIDAFFMLAIISITLSIIGVKFGILIGVLTGIGNLIPYMGPLVAYVFTTLVCVINGDYKILMIALIALFIIQIIDGNFIGPKLLSHAIEIHPLIVIISLIFGSAVGGFLGMLLAVPVGAYIKLVFVQYIDKKVEKKQVLYSDSYAKSKANENDENLKNGDGQ